MSLTIFLSYKVAQKENRKETLERVNLLYPLKADTQLTKVFLLSHKLSFSKVQVLYINSPQNAYLLKKKKLIYKLYYGISFVYVYVRECTGTCGSQRSTLESAITFHLTFEMRSHQFS